MINFNDIEDKKFVIEFNNKKELDKLIDFLEKENYKYGNTDNDLEELREELKSYNLTYFVDKKKITLDRRKIYSSNDIVFIGDSYMYPKYEYKNIIFDKDIIFNDAKNSQEDILYNEALEDLESTFEHLLNEKVEEYGTIFTQEVMQLFYDAKKETYINYRLNTENNIEDITNQGEHEYERD